MCSYLITPDLQGEGARRDALQALLCSLPYAHYDALALIARHLSSLAGSNEDIIYAYVQTYGPLLLRPLHETKLTIHDHHPFSIARDLIVGHEYFFSTREPVLTEMHSRSQSRSQVSDDLEAEVANVMPSGHATPRLSGLTITETDALNDVVRIPVQPAAVFKDPSGDAASVEKNAESHFEIE